MSKILVIGSIPFSLVNFRKNLLVRLRQSGHDVVAAAGGEDSEVAENLAAAGIEYQSTIVERNSYGVFGAFKGMLSLYRLIRKVKPDVVLLYTIQPVLFGSLMSWIAGVPRIYSMITGVGALFIHKTWKTRIAKIVLWPLYKLALSRNQRVIFQNLGDRKDLLDWRIINESTRWGRMPSSGVDRTHYAPAPLPPTDQVQFLYSARFIREKGIVELLEAGRILRERGLDFAITFVGGDLGESTRVPDEELDRLASYANATRHEWAKDVREFIRNCHVFVLPTYREGAPRSILEAMAMGRAAITTDTPGARDVVEKDVNAFVVPARDAEALADAMQKFIEQPELIQKFADESVRIVRDVHCADAVADLTIELIDETPPITAATT